MFGLALNADLSGLRTTKSDEPKPIAVTFARPQHQLQKARPEDWQAMAETLKLQTRWNIHKIMRRDRSLRVEIAYAPVFDWSFALDQANAVMHAMAPAEIANFTYVLFEKGLPLTELSIDRNEWARDQTEFVPKPIRLKQPEIHDPLI
jgi:hypothetical protein